DVQRGDGEAGLTAAEAHSTQSLCAIFECDRPGRCANKGERRLDRCSERHRLTRLGGILRASGGREGAAGVEESGYCISCATNDEIRTAISIKISSSQRIGC